LLARIRRPNEGASGDTVQAQSRSFDPSDAGIAKQRNRIARDFDRLKHFRRFDTCRDRRTCHFAGFAFLATAMIWLCGMSIPPRK
jgi:transposase